jgi:hypothetical protein
MVSMLFGLLLFVACESDNNSAYDIYKSTYIATNGSDDCVLSESEWLDSLKGEQGQQGDQGKTGETGKSAYELYLDEYTNEYGSSDGVLTEPEWLASLKGEQGETGETGKSAYELYLDAYITEYGSSDGALTEPEWLASLKGNIGAQGETGKSAYDIYLDAYVEVNGNADGVLNETEWLASLKGEQGKQGETGSKGVGINKVEIVCGGIIIYFDNETSKTIEGAYPEAGHNWNSGEVTTSATCITPGVITYACANCGDTKKELTDADGEHVFIAKTVNDNYHLYTCALCGTTTKEEHSKEDNLDEDSIICTVCDYDADKADYAYNVSFNVDSHVTILLYKTQDYNVDGVSSLTAYSRDGDSGNLTTKDGQVNFKIVFEDGYCLDTITVTDGYKNLKNIQDDTYRITKITDNLEVTITTTFSYVEALSLPVMVINTVDATPIVDKVNYITCGISVLNADEEYCFYETSASIKGRGNATWNDPKKPYKLKFDSKIDLFGNGAAKKWVLLNNYNDNSLIRNYLAYTVGGQLEGITDSTTKVQLIEVYLNGEYEGVYALCEQNEVGETRVNISDDIKNSDGNRLLDTGYLIEMDFRAPQEGIDGYDYFTLSDLDYGDKKFVTWAFNGKKYFTLKSPEVEGIEASGFTVEDYVNFIKDYTNQCLSAISSGTYAEVCDLIDVNSFADSYVVNELFKSIDVGITSFWLYKKEGSKLYSGPIWDYDNCCGNTINVNYPSVEKTDYLYAKETNIWYYYLLQFDEFQELVAARLAQYSSAISETIESSVNYVLANSNSFLRNFERWDTLDTKTWQKEVTTLKEWLDESLEYLLSIYCVEEIEELDGKDIE